MKAVFTIQALILKDVKEALILKTMTYNVLLLNISKAMRKELEILKKIIALNIDKKVQKLVK